MVSIPTGVFSAEGVEGLWGDIATSLIPGDQGTRPDTYLAACQVQLRTNLARLLILHLLQSPNVTHQTEVASLQHLKRAIWIALNEQEHVKLK